MEQVIEIARHPSSEGVHHEVHPFLHHLHLRDYVGGESYLWRMVSWYLATLACSG